MTAHQILHNLEADRCLDLLRRARAALKPGGILAVLEPEQPPPGRRGSLIPTLGSLAFLTFTATRCWTAAELRDFFARAGLTRIEERRPLRLSGNVVIVGGRPGDG